MSKELKIIGAGLAGCCLGWQLLRRGQPFSLYEDSPNEAGSLVAAGMLAPVTGKAFNPSWKIDEFYEDAIEFYRWVESQLNQQVWYTYPVLRLFYDDKDRRKFDKKLSSNPDLKKWVLRVEEEAGTYGGVIWSGSGRLNVNAFVLSSRAYFQSLGIYHEEAFSPEGPVIFTTGVRGLVERNPLDLPHRSAKGEILRVRIPGLPEDQILSRGTWLVPTGDQDESFWVGANYDWDDLSNTPTEQGRESVLKGLSTLIDSPFEVIEHVAGVRPIIRKSEPVIGAIEKDRYLLNGLGSKGVLYAPKSVEYLLDYILDGKEIPSYLALAELL